MLEINKNGIEMINIEWVIISISNIVLIGVISLILFLRKLRSIRFRLLQKREKTVIQEIMILANSLVVLGIVFGTDRIISYLLIGTGVLLSIVSAILSHVSME